jgi:hypothetical protein
MYAKCHAITISLVVLTMISASCLCQQAQGADRSSAPVSMSGPQSQIAFDSDDSAPIVLRPALHGVLAPSRQPAGRRPVLWSLFGQRAELGIFAVGNFNPVTNIYINNEPHQAVSSNKSSLGGGLEYRRWFSDHTALGLLYTQNPSDGKLLWQGQNYIWPQMRWDMAVLATERVNIGNFAPFVSGGPGVLLTNGYGNCGWSGSFAVVSGAGTDYRLSRRLTARTGISFLITKSGCYQDPTCQAKSGMVEDLRLGFVYKWGGESGSALIR